MEILHGRSFKNGKMAMLVQFLIKSSHLEASWAHLGDILGYLGPILGSSWAIWGHLGGHLGAILGHLERSCAFLGPSWPS